MIGKLASSTTIAISLVVLIGMYILYRDMKKLKCPSRNYRRGLPVLKYWLHHPSVWRIEEERGEEEGKRKEDDDEEVIIQEVGVLLKTISRSLNKLKDEIATEEQS
jgi:hypothetical protein